MAFLKIIALSVPNPNISSSKRGRAQMNADQGFTLITLIARSVTGVVGRVMAHLNRIVSLVLIT